MKLAGRFRWLLEKKCREHDIDVQLIDPELTYHENLVNIEKLAHQTLTKHKVRHERKRKKEPIKDIGESLRDMGFPSDTEYEASRMERLAGRGHEEEI